MSLTSLTEKQFRVGYCSKCGRPHDAETNDNWWCPQCLDEAKKPTEELFEMPRVIAYGILMRLSGILDQQPSSYLCPNQAAAQTMMVAAGHLIRDTVSQQTVDTLLLEIKNLDDYCEAMGIK